MERGKVRRSRAHARLAGIGESAAHEHALNKRKVAVGSAADSDLVVGGPTVSRHHAIISRWFGRYRVTDLNSTNGTFLNNRRISGPAPIAKGDELRFGAARFVFLDAPGAEKRAFDVFAPDGCRLRLDRIPAQPNHRYCPAKGCPSRTPARASRRDGNANGVSDFHSREKYSRGSGKSRCADFSGVGRARMA